jgi:hypothetical protein
VWVEREREREREGEREREREKEREFSSVHCNQCFRQRVLFSLLPHLSLSHTHRCTHTLNLLAGEGRKLVDGLGKVRFLV